MPMLDDAAIEISAFNWVPPFARGRVRDIRVRWALEEAGLDYRVRAIDPREKRSADYLALQPFGQVPYYREGALCLFESGAILLHLGERSEALMPRDPGERARATQWLIAALNSVEPVLAQLLHIDFFSAGKSWTEARRPEVIETAETRLARLAAALGEREWLVDSFSAADIMMVSVLGMVRHTELVAAHPALAAYQARGEARAAHQRAFADQCATFDAHQPEGAVA